MAGNSFGTLFRFTTWGESHGVAIGCVVDGVPPRLPLAEPDIQYWLDRRRPGQSKFTTQPIAPPWLSPQVVKRKSSPKLLPAIDARDQTTEMSGASTAFMPTT